MRYCARIRRHCQHRHPAGSSRLLSLDVFGGITIAGMSTGDEMNNTEPNIKNVFVLMLENHSFDNIFAMSGIQDINVATVQDSNSYQGETYPCGMALPTV